MSYIRCTHCGNEAPPSPHEYCSDECKDNHNDMSYNRCKHCGNEARHPRDNYCSDRCEYNHNYNEKYQRLPLVKLSKHLYLACIALHLASPYISHAQILIDEKTYRLLPFISILRMSLYPLAIATILINLNIYLDRPNYYEYKSFSEQLMKDFTIYFYSLLGSYGIFAIEPELSNLPGILQLVFAISIMTFLYYGLWLVLINILVMTYYTIRRLICLPIKTFFTQQKSKTKT